MGRRSHPTATGITEQRKDLVTPQLSCELCRERKVKCDKLEPCSNCAVAGVACVPTRRLRLPRGRHAPRSPRVPPLQQWQSTHDRPAAGRRRRPPPTGSATAAASSTQAITLLAPASPEGPENNIEKQGPTAGEADSTWEALGEEIHTLRRDLDSVPSEADGSNAPTPGPPPMPSTDDGMRILGMPSPSSPAAVARQVGQTPAVPFHDRVIGMKLCQVYLDQVDPVIKVLHRPSVYLWLIQGSGYLAYPDGHASTEALRSAILYSAISSMTEARCRELLHARRAVAVAECRQLCEARLESSGLLSTQDITVLQAFFLYLVARRIEERSRPVWTLFAVAVRLAKDICFRPEPATELGRGDTFFAQQMRKRLWFTICVFDIKLSFGQSAKPLTSTVEPETMTLPANVNDSDFSPATEHEVPDREGLTDITFALITYHMLPYGHQVISALRDEKRSPAPANPGNGSPLLPTTFLPTTPHPEPNNGPEPGPDTEADRACSLRHLQTFEQNVFALLHFCDPESSPYAWLTFHTAHCFVAAARLASASASAAALVRHTLTVLDAARRLHTDPRGRAFRWCASIPWHSLAVAFARRPAGVDVRLVRRAWPLVEAACAAAAADNPLSRAGEVLRRTREELAPVLQPQPGEEAGDGEPGQGLSPPELGLQPWGLDMSAYGVGGTVADTPLADVDLGLPVDMSVAISDQPWRTWEEFLTSMSFEDSGGSGML